MPEEKHPMRIAAHKARSKDYIRKTADHRLEQIIIFIRIIFQIGILYDQVIPLRLRNSSVKRGSFTHVHRVFIKLNIQLRVTVHILTNAAGRIILATIVYDDDLFSDIIDKPHCLNLVQDKVYGLLLVISGNDYR